MGKLVRKDRTRVSHKAATVTSLTKSPVVKTTAFKAKTTITANQTKAHPKVTTKKAAALKSTRSVVVSDEAPAAVTIAPVASPNVPTEKRQITKKEKIQNRHDNLMRKVNSALEVKRSAQLKAKSAKTTKKQLKQKFTSLNKTTAQGVRQAMADMSQLKNALPTLDDQLPSLNSLFQLKSKDLKTGVPKFDAKAKKAAAAAAASSTTGAPRKVSKTTNTLNKKNEFMQRYNHFQKLSTDKTFKMNPRQVIAAHIRNRQAQQI